MFKKEPVILHRCLITKNEKDEKDGKEHESFSPVDGGKICFRRQFFAVPSQMEFRENSKICHTYRFKC